MQFRNMDLGWEGTSGCGPGINKILDAQQVISFTVHANQEHAKEVANIERTVNRIQWALREILPKM